MAKPSINAILKAHLADVEAHVRAAKNATDIKEIAAKIEKHAQGNEYKFNQTLPIIGFVLSGLFALFAWWEQISIRNDQRTMLLFIGGLIACICLTIIWSRFSRIKSVSVLTYVRAVAINANIERDYNYDGKSYWNELRQIFSLFNCGDEGQTITKRYLGRVEQTPFTLFEFKYVDVSTHTSTDGKGGSTTSKQRTTRYKFGMLVHFSDFNYVSINVKRFSNKWDSSSQRFNRLFKIRCASEIAAAKFFDPKTVLTFIDNFHFLESLELTAQSVACIELPKEVFPTQIKSPNLRDHELFIRHLRNPASIPLLEKSKELVQFINRQK